MNKKNLNYHNKSRLWLTHSPFLQSGVSLIITLIALLAMTMTGLAIMRASNTSNLIAGNLGFHQAAVQSADLGVETAIPVYQGVVSANATLADDSSINYYASYSGNTLPPSSRLSDSTLNKVTDTNTSNEIRYVIERMCSDNAVATTTNCLMDGSDPYFRISTLVNGPRGTSANTQIYVSGGASFSPQCAITVQTYLEIPGTPNLTGDQDCVHSNDYVYVGGGSGSLGEVRAVYSVGDDDKIEDMGGTDVPNQAPVSLPVINPVDFKSYADYIFETDGHIYDSSGTDLGTSWQGWSRTSTGPDIWTKGDSSPSPAGLYYFEGNVEVSGSVGSAVSLWNVSLIATNAIQISGECYFENYLNPSPSVPDGVNNIFMMAGGDLEYNGNPTQSVQGIMAVGEELKINGNPNLAGYIIATNATPSGDPSGFSDHIDKNELSGSFTLNYDSGSPLTSPWGSDLNRHAWRSIGQ